MTAHCPCCGRKWEGRNDYELILRCGDEHDIKCLGCKRVIPFVVERSFLEQTINAIQIKGYEKLVKEQEAQIIEYRELLRKYEHE